MATMDHSIKVSRYMTTKPTLTKKKETKKLMANKDAR